MAFLGGQTTGFFNSRQRKERKERKAKIKHKKQTKTNK